MLNSPPPPLNSPTTMLNSPQEELATAAAALEAERAAHSTSEGTALLNKLMQARGNSPSEAANSPPEGTALLRKLMRAPTTMAPHRSPGNLRVWILLT
eukprot:1188625-Prorocentrum_minimum.AAC.5